MVCENETLGDLEIEWSDQCAACIMEASGGYPLSYPKGIEIKGLDEKGQVEGAFVYHAGTKLSEDGRFLTNGGRVLGVTCTALTLEEALRRSYEAVDKITWENVHFRHDIGKRALQAHADPLDLYYKDDMEDYIESNGVYLRQ